MWCLMCAKGGGILKICVYLLEMKKVYCAISNDELVFIVSSFGIVCDEY